MVYFCRAHLFGLPDCQHYRRSGWGVCRLCWRNHIEKDADAELRYHTKWTSEFASPVQQGGR